MEIHNGTHLHAAAHVDPAYSSGDYFIDPRRHSEDAQFKADCFLRAFVPLARRHPLTIRSYADVGCGSGEIVRLVCDGLKQADFAPERVQGYDVSPHVTRLRAAAIQFVHGNFAETGDHVDLVTLFDVVEHVFGAVDFLRAVAARSKVVALHLPLDDSINHALRDKFRTLMRDPGHVLFLDTVSALNLCSLAGLRVLSYQYTPTYRSPSGHRSLPSKLLFPLRALLHHVSPWLLAKSFGGLSLLIIAVTPRFAGCGVDNKTSMP